MKQLNPKFIQMKKIIFIFVVGVFLVSIVSAYGIVSNDYSVGSYHLGIAGQEPINSQYDSIFTLTYQQPGEKDTENIDYTANIGWLSFSSFCGDGVCDADENCSTCPADCGTCPVVPDDGDGGGDAGCTYDWVCSAWYPSPCPANEIQRRVCVNRGSCTGTLGMPDIIRNCTYVPVEPLFDIFARIPLSKKWINPGDTAEIDVKLINLGEIIHLDVLFKYTIVSEDNILITELQETRAITKGEEFKVIMNLPSNIEVGKYKFYVEINYDTDKVALAQDSFNVIESKIGKFILMSLLWIIIFLIIFVVIILFSRLRQRESVD